jgi:hypothetical protein
MPFEQIAGGFAAPETRNSNVAAASSWNVPSPTRANQVKAAEVTFGDSMLRASGGWLSWRREISESSFDR